VIDYWERRGATYEDEFQRTTVFEEQEERLMTALRASYQRSPWDSILEVGCGFGRITELVRQEWPGVYIEAVDVSSDQLVRAVRHIPDVNFKRSSIQDYQPTRRFGLVLAVETLMHVPPDEIHAVTRKMIGLATRWVVTLDWAPDGPLPERIAPHNWAHDYIGLLWPLGYREQVGGQAIHVHRRADDRMQG